MLAHLNGSRELPANAEASCCDGWLSSKEMIMVHVGSHYLRMLRYGQQLMVLSLCTLLIVALRAHCCPIVAMQMAMPARSIVLTSF
mmetsp:Transcript_25336/g.68843  ORF Transcript_25336/g.68843 Transcript_25336/m.68843 type:complete len:86 (+) Transcript_25336:672-929(+)